MRGWNKIGIGTALFLLVAGFSFLSSDSAGEEKNLKQMITEAKTPADHQAVVGMYRAEGTRLQKEANHHTELAQWWTKLAGGEAFGSARYQQAEHCRRYADLLEQAAKEAHALANGHERMAQSTAAGEK